MTTDLAEWLAAREPPPPSPLADALAAAIDALPAARGPVALVLADAGALALRRALALGDERAAAWELLTADALFTYAVEAAAEQGSDTLDALLESWQPSAFARLIEPRT